MKLYKSHSLIKLITVIACSNLPVHAMDSHKVYSSDAPPPIHISDTGLISYDPVSLFNDDQSRNKKRQPNSLSYETTNKFGSLMAEISENTDSQLPLNTNTELLSVYKKFAQIPTEAFIYFKTNFERNAYKIPNDERIYLSNVIDIYENLAALFQKTAPLPQFIDTATPKAIQKLYDAYSQVINSQGFTKIEQIQEAVIDFSYSINIDQMLFAYPTSLLKKIEQSNVHIDSIANVGSERSTSNAIAHNTISNEDFIQKFAVYNADADSVFEAYIIIKAEDYEKIKHQKRWSVKDILCTRFNNLSHSREFVDAYWVYENQAGELFSTRIYNDKHNAASVFTINHYHIDNRLSGVFYGGAKSKRLINHYHSMFTFESSLPVIKPIPTTKLCINNESNYSILTNKRTKRSSKAGYRSRNCIDARIGDLVTLHQYTFFPPSEPTATYVVLNPRNKMNNFIKTNIYSAYPGFDLSYIKK